MNVIFDFLKDVSKKVTDIPIVLFDSDNFHTFFNGNKVEVPIPQAIVDVIRENKTFKLFKQKDEYVYIFVISVTFDGTVCRLIIKDKSDYFGILQIVSALMEYSYLSAFSEKNLAREVDLLREELEECEKELGEVYEKYSNLEEDISKKNYEIEGLEESVKVLRNSRQKMLKLIDGLNIPLFSIDLNYELLNVNRSVSHFTGEKDLPKFIGSKCYRLIFKNDDICQWCKASEVMETKKSVCQHITIEKEGKKFVYEHTMYPIFDNNGDVIEFGEYLSDISEQYNLIENLKKSKEQIIKISKEKIESINEISSLRAEYEKLVAAYEESQTKVNKLSLALQKVLEQSTVNEVLRLKSENKDLRLKIDRLENAVENYKKAKNDESGRLAEAIKKSVYSLDRLINMVDKRKKIEDKDLKNIHEFVVNEIRMLKKIIDIKEDSDDNKSSD
ncbi:MAG: hypothetical protein JG762_1180 [Deferribacteraceae bacterium]|jgi:peptidoglycan hydrolase CwlO-like protein|nr:hypothetical protein [Deferribacteraceae bacterium]